MRKIFLCTLILFVFVSNQALITLSAEALHSPMTCEERLKNLEPPEPKTIYDYELLRDRDLSRFKGEVLPIKAVLKKGSKIPYATVYKDLNLQRPAYYSFWHSTNWRWSNVPINMAYQQHKVYDYEGGNSWWFDLSMRLALPEGAGGPSPLHEFAFTIKYPYIVRLIVFNFDIKSIKHYKNQICVTGEPLRKGLTLVDFDSRSFSDSDKLLHLVTPDGYEIDNLILQLYKH